MGLAVIRFVGEVHDVLVCSLCTGVLDDPVEIPQCEHAFCRQCIRRYIRSQEATCPIDAVTVSESELRTAPRILRNMLARLDIACVNASQGCHLILKLEHLAAHESECEYDSKTLMACEGGCGARMKKDALAAHICFAELRRVMGSYEKAMGSVAAQLTQQRNDMRDLREEMMTMKRLFAAWQVRDQHVSEATADVLRMYSVEWGRGLVRAQVTCWQTLQPAPQDLVQRMVRRTLAETACPSSLLELLMIACVEWQWPEALRSAESRRRHVAHLDHLVFRRLPGKQVVVVLFADNPHMCSDFVKDPGYVLVFNSGVKIHTAQ